jgi:hypothetical protein
MEDDMDLDKLTSVAEQKKLDEVISPHEQAGILAVCALNRLDKQERLEINRSWSCGRLSVALRWRSRKCFMGRFGGGWNWKIGVAWSRSCIIADLLVFSVQLRVPVTTTGLLP